MDDIQLQTLKRQAETDLAAAQAYISLLESLAGLNQDKPINVRVICFRDNWIMFPIGAGLTEELAVEAAARDVYRMFCEEHAPDDEGIKDERDTFRDRLWKMLTEGKYQDLLDCYEGEWCSPGDQEINTYTLELLLATKLKKNPNPKS